MTNKILNEKEIYKTADLALATAIFLFYPLEAIDKPSDSKKAYFLFKRESGLDELIESYWRGELKVEPQAYFNALRVIKARLYGERMIC
jgi:hypothetical protein